MANPDEARIQHIQELVEKLEGIQDEASRATARALVEAILQLHGLGLERMMEIVFDAGEPGKAAIRRFAGDGLVSSLLVLHGLHPDDLETRVHQVLGKLHARTELLGVFEGVVRVRLLDSRTGLAESVEAAIRDGVPDAVDVIISESAPLSSFVPLSSLGMAVSGSA